MAHQQPSAPPPYSEQDDKPPLPMQWSGPPPVASYPATGAYPSGTYQTTTAYPAASVYPQQVYQPPVRGYGQPVVHTTYVQQPVVSAGQPMVHNAIPPRDNAALAWLSCLFCFWPTGIVAIINSHQVTERMRLGDYHGALQASNRARQFSLISIGIGVASYVLGVVLLIIYMSVFASALSNRSY